MKRGKRTLSGLLCMGIILGSIFSYKVVSNANEFEGDGEPLNLETSLPNDDNISQETITLGKDNEIKISIMNDFHYFSHDLYSDCEDFTYDAKAEKKLLLESDAVLQQAMKEVIAEKPDVILVGGDMSKDSEKINHEKVAERLAEAQATLKSLGVDTKICVTNGNHDINCNARDYSSGETVCIPGTTVSEFKEIYKDFGYGDGSEYFTTEENVGGCLSYATDIGKGYTLIVVDTNKYTPDQTSTGLAKAEVGGVISDNLLKWIEEQAAKAYQMGKIPVVLQHHAVTPHFTGQEYIGGNFIVKNHEKIGQAYADAGIKVVFTGHSHASDIATAKTNDGSIVYDIMTSSLTGYPVTTRNVNLANEEGKLYVDTRVNFLESIDYIDEATGKKIENIQEYVFDDHMGVEATKVLMSDKTLELGLNKVKQKGGTKATLAEVLKVNEEDLNDKIVDMITTKLPQNEENAIAISFMKCNFGLFYDTTDNCVYLKQKLKNPKFSKMAVELKISIEEVKNLLEKTYSDLDENVINNKDGVNKVFEEIVDNMFNYKIDGTNTAYDYYKNGYNYYKVGEPVPNDFIESSTGKLKKTNKYAKKFINTFFLKSIRKDMKNLLKNNELELEKVIIANNDNFTTKSIVKIITSSFENLGEVWSKVARISFVPDKVIELTNKAGIFFIEGLAVDTDVPEDNDFSAIMDL